MIQQREDPRSMQSLFPLLLTSILGNGDSSNDNKMYLLLLGAGQDQNMQQWLPLILNNNKKGTDDKILMIMFMQQMQAQGNTGMDNMFPLMILNNDEEKYCDSGSTGKKCTCKDDNGDLILYIMLMGQANTGPGQNYNNFMFLLFDDKKCDGTDTDSNSCSCTSDVKGGIDAVTYMLMMQMNQNQVKRNIPQAPPARAVDISSVLRQQMFRNLGPEYAWMAEAAGNFGTDNLVKLQLYTQMGIPPNVVGMLTDSSSTTQTADERFALIQWMSEGSNLNIETMSLMLGITDAKNFYIQGMIEQGKIEPLTASLLLASQGNSDKDRIKEILILAATGQIDPANFATISRPYIPRVLPQGVFPGQDLYFIQLELLQQDTCALIEPQQRAACKSNFGASITAEQCEEQPYCCYNPYFGDQVNGRNVPWCYYNIFFIFHDTYKLKVKNADQFRGPQECPGLFRYNLQLDPFLYHKAVKELQLEERSVGANNKVSFSNVNDLSGTTGKLAKLIHLRRDMGFPGITQFQCEALKGACWDAQAARYPGYYNIPQCYIEVKISYGATVEKALRLYDPELFKASVPTEFQTAQGECDTNHFQITQLYYQRRACGYSIDMLKYRNDLESKINEEPSRNDCLFRLGCCYEENPEILAKFPFMPKCYHRVAPNMDELFGYTLVTVTNNNQVVSACGSTLMHQVITTYIQGSKFSAIEANVLAAADTLFGKGTYNFVPGAGKDFPNDEFDATTGEHKKFCLYINDDYDTIPTKCASATDCAFWNAFKIMDKENDIKKFKENAAIPKGLRSDDGGIFDAIFNGEVSFRNL